MGAFLGPYIAKLGSKAASKLGAKKAIQGSCFVEGTLVLAEDGHRPIEEIKVGDYVYAENPETGEKELKQVV